MALSLRNLFIAALGCGAASSLQAQPPWSGQTFLPDYSLLKAIPTKHGQDYVFLDQSFDPKSINGQVMTDLTDESPKALKDGVIALQLHAGYTMEIQFKDVKIKLMDEKK